MALGGTGTAGNPQLTIGAASLSFGSIAVNTPTTQSLVLTSTGTTPVIVNSATITGAGFTLIGGSFPVTINPNQTLTLQLQFDPTTAGALTGQITIKSNSTTGNSAVVGLSGTGVGVAHEVDPQLDGTGQFTRSCGWIQHLSRDGQRVSCADQLVARHGSGLCGQRCDERRQL